MGLVFAAQGRVAGSIAIQWQERDLLHGTALALTALSEKEDAKEHRKCDAHEDGNGKNFHVRRTKRSGAGAALRSLL